MKSIRNPIYNYSLVIFAGGSVKSAKRYVEVKTGAVFKDESECLEACCITVVGCKNHVLWFESVRPKYSTITHECAHSVSHVFRELGARLSEDTEEVYAYLLDWTVAEVLRKLKMPNEVRGSRRQ